MKHDILILVFCLLCFNIYSQKMLSFQQANIPKPLLIDSEVNYFNVNQHEFNSLSSSDKEFFYWVNYSRKNPKRFYDSVILPIINVYPQLKGPNLISLKIDLYASSVLPLLSLNSILNNLAQQHANDITSKNLPPSHNSSNGRTFIERFQDLHFRNCGSENISYGLDEPVFLLSLLYLDIGIEDLGHRKALLNSSLIETGIGSAFYKNGYLFLVEDFSCKHG